MLMASYRPRCLRRPGRRRGRRARRARPSARFGGGIREVGLALITLGVIVLLFVALPAVGHGHRRGAQPGRPEAGLQRRRGRGRSRPTTAP